MDHIAEGNAPIAPHRRLKRQSRILSWLILLAFSVAALIDIAEVSSFLFRAGSLCGVMDGGFAFVVDFPPFRETTDSLPASFISVSRLAVWQSVLAAGLLALRLVPGLVILGSLYLLFRTYAGGQIFTHGNTAHIRR